MRPLLIFLSALLIIACSAVVKNANTTSYTIQNLNWNLANVSLECTSGRILKRVWNISTGESVRGRVALAECRDTRAHVTFVGSREEITLDLIGWREGLQVDITIANSLTFTTYRVR